MSLYFVYSMITGEILTYFREYIVALDYLDSIDGGVETLNIVSLHFEDINSINNFVNSLRLFSKNITNYNS